MHAVILAGGKGTRLRPLTDTRPKPLLPFMGEPFAVGLLRRLAAAGCDRATFLVGDAAAPWRGLGDAGVAVDVVTEEAPLDTAGAARRLLRGRAHGPVLVCNGDILTDLDFGALLAAHDEAGAAATIALTRVADTASFGVVVCDDDGRVRRFVEKPPPGTVAADTVNAGTYVLAPEAFDPFPGDGPLSFERAVFPGLLDAGAVLRGVVSDGHWQDIGTPDRYLAGHRAVLDGRCAWPAAAGFRSVGRLAMVHESARVDRSADVGVAVVVGPRCVVGAGARVADAVLHAGVEVGEEAQVCRAILGENARVGVAAVVGPEAVLGDGQAVAAAARHP
ncbi:MAG TPA: NDP-sugar synthase [Egibacteraceae bacterium]|jgi:mannose-1-phosphate guanylyltransferase|nr:NDP-sugar synthase [Egibacteraceae bacterium]